MQMHHVKRMTAKDGTVRFYFQKKGQPLVRLLNPAPDVWEGSAMQREVDDLLGRLAPVPAPQTLAAALRDYECRSADFAGLAETTKALYRVALGEFADQLGDVPAAAFKPAYIAQLRDLWAQRGHRAANNRLQVLKNVLKPAMVAGVFGGADPFALIAGVRRPRTLAEPHPIWSPEAVDAVIKRAIAERWFGLARGIALGRYAGARRGDIVSITRAARQGGRLRFLSGKRKVKVDMREDPRLTAWLAATPQAQPFTRDQARRRRMKGVVAMPASTIVYNREGQRYTEGGFGQAVATVVGLCHASGEIDADHYDAHGLRHSFGVELAIAGCSDAEGAAMMGHHSPNSFAQYRRQADRIRLADASSDRLDRSREQVENG